MTQPVQIQKTTPEPALLGQEAAGREPTGDGLGAAPGPEPRDATRGGLRARPRDGVLRHDAPSGPGW